MSHEKRTQALAGISRSPLSLFEFPLLAAMATWIQYLVVGQANPFLWASLSCGFALLLLAGWSTFPETGNKNNRWIGAAGLGLLSTISILTFSNLSPQVSGAGAKELVFLMFGLFGYFVLPGRVAHVGLLVSGSALSFAWSQSWVDVGLFVSGLTLVSGFRFESECRVSDLNSKLEHAASELNSRQALEKNLQESRNISTLLAKVSAGGIWDWDLDTNRMHLSPRLKAMVGLENDNLFHEPEHWFGCLDPVDREILREQIQQHLQGKTPQIDLECRLAANNGSSKWMWIRGLSMKDTLGKPGRIVGTQVDITDRKETEKDLYHRAFHDSLTELPNKVLFNDRLDHALKLAKRREDYRFAVLFMDLDGFKKVNDDLGHLAGDQLIQKAARRLETVLRDVDMVARLGGDEFAFILDDVKDLSDALKTVHRIKEKFLEPFQLRNQSVLITTSIGVVWADHSYAKAEQILADSDAAMYQAKKEGKNGYSLSNPPTALQNSEGPNPVPEEARQVPRFDMSLPCVISSADKEHKAELVNLSLEGAYVSSSLLPPNGDMVYLSFRTTKGSNLKMSARIVRCVAEGKETEPAGIGVHFTACMGGTLETLRSLLQEAAKDQAFVPANYSRTNPRHTFSTN